MSNERLGGILAWAGVVAFLVFVIVLGWTTVYYEAGIEFHRFEGERYMVNVIHSRDTDSMIVNVMHGDVLLADLVEYNSEWDSWGFFRPTRTNGHRRANRRFRGQRNQYENVIRFMLERGSE